MDKAIWKFPVEITDLQSIEMPIGAEILTVQTQHDKPMLWALVDPSAKRLKYHFELFGTGHPVACGMGTERKYIGTFQVQDGHLVFHLFQYTGV